MFGLFESPKVHDPEFGEMSRSRGKWRGFVMLAGARAPLILAGGRAGPDGEALALARQAVQQYASWRPEIEAALFEHFSPYAEAVAAGEEPSPDEPLPKIEGPGQVWPHVTVEYLAVTPLDGVLTTEVGYMARWDDEHTLGARFQEGRFVELNGSVLRP